MTESLTYHRFILLMVASALTSIIEMLLLMMMLSFDLTEEVQWIMTTSMIESIIHPFSIRVDSDTIRTLFCYFFIKSRLIIFMVPRSVKIPTVACVIETSYSRV